MDLTQRIASMDLLRGLAILGILFMNIVAFAAPEPAYMSPAWVGEPSLSDKIAYSFQYIFANSRFYSLFCLLFGAGLVMFWQRAELKGYNAKALISSRLRWLLLFGILHLTLLFFGDILISYALCGMLLVSAISDDSDRLMRRGIIFIGVATAIFTLVAFLSLGEVPKEERMLAIPLSPEDASALINQATGSFGAMVWYNIKYGGVLLLALPLMFWLLGGIMLLGMALIKRGFFYKGLSNKQEFTLFIIGFALSAGQLTLLWLGDFLENFALLLPANMVAAVMLAVAIGSRGVKMCNNNSQFCMPLQYAGRMAFSLYIFQSLTMTILFRWLAPELFGAMPRVELLGIAAVMTILQLLLATWWQTKIGQGPLERMWRHLIYRNHQSQNKKIEPSIT